METSLPDRLFRDLGPLTHPLPEGASLELPTPGLCIWMEHVRGNVARMLEYVDGEPLRWRPHVKTTKIPEVWSVLARAGVRRFKCATVREMTHLLRTLREEGIEEADVLLAHPLTGPGLDRLGQLAVDHDEQRLGVLVEDPESVEAVPDLVTLFVDVNTGMDRTGAPLSDPARIEATALAAGDRLRGFHAYDGDRHEPLEADRRKAAFAVYDQLLEVLAPLESLGEHPLELCTSGTPAFRSALAYEPFGASAFEHTISPGTVVFHDLRSEQENEQLGLVPAALVVTRVISHPRSGRVTLDAGSKSVGADAGQPVAFVLGHPELELREPSEEHLPLEIPEGYSLPRGSILSLVPRHVCTTVNLAEEALLIDGDGYRKVPVPARAH